MFFAKILYWALWALAAVTLAFFLYVIFAVDDGYTEITKNQIKDDVLIFENKYKTGILECYKREETKLVLTSCVH